MATEIRFQATPNPNAAKFIAGRRLVDGNRPRSFATLADAAADPLAAAVFAIDGVAAVFMVEDFVTVTKAADASWARLTPEVTAAMREVLD